MADKISILKADADSANAKGLDAPKVAADATKVAADAPKVAADASKDLDANAAKTECHRVEKKDIPLVEELTDFYESPGLNTASQQLSPGFNSASKQRWFEKKRTIEVGLIKTSELDKRVTIYTEAFDFSKKKIQKGGVQKGVGLQKGVDGEDLGRGKRAKKLTTKGAESDNSALNAILPGERRAAAVLAARAKEAALPKVPEKPPRVKKVKVVQEEDSNSVYNPNDEEEEEDDEEYEEYEDDLESVASEDRAEENKKADAAKAKGLEKARAAKAAKAASAKAAADAAKAKGLEKVNVGVGPEESTSANASVGPSEISRKNASVGTSGPLEANVKGSPFNTRNAQEPQLVQDHIVGTVVEFDKLYLGWTTDDNEKSMMRYFFRFIFGTKKIKDLTKLHNKFRYAYTNFKPEEKLPCNTEYLNNFKKSLEYRLGILETEMSYARDIGIPEVSAFIDSKKGLKFGLQTLLEVIGEGGPCFTFTGEMHDDAQDNSSRLIGIFKEFVKKRKTNPGEDEEDLRKKLKEPWKYPEYRWKTTYRSLIELLEWKADEKETETLRKNLTEVTTNYDGSVDEIARLKAIINLLATFIVYKDKLDSFGKSVGEFKELLVNISFASDALRDLNKLLSSEETSESNRRIIEGLKKSVEDYLKRFEEIAGENSSKGASGPSSTGPAPPVAHSGGAYEKAEPYKRLVGIIKKGDTEDVPREVNKNDIDMPQIMLSALLLNAQSKGQDVKELVENANKVLNEYQRSLILNIIEKLVDLLLKQDYTQEGYTFVPIEENYDEITSLVDSYTSVFKEDPELIDNIAQIHKSSGKYKNILGDNPYLLCGNPPIGDSTQLTIKDLEDDIYLTGEERADIEEGGIPLGGLILLYLVCMSSKEDAENDSEDDGLEDHEVPKGLEEEDTSDEDTSDEDDAEDTSDEEDNAPEEDKMHLDAPEEAKMDLGEPIKIN